MSWFGRKHKPEDNPEVKQAMESRDAVLADANESLAAAHESLREAGAQNAIIDEYIAAQERLNGTAS